MDEQRPEWQPYGQQTTTSYPGCGYFTEQAIRSGYIIPGFGPANEYFNSGSGQASENFLNPIDELRRFEIELEKERIRRGIIEAEIARKQALLEAELRRTMMIDRELASRDRVGVGVTGAGGGGQLGSAFGGSSFPLGSRMGLSLEERIAMSLEDKIRIAARCETRGIEMVPFQPCRVEPKFKVVVPSPSDYSRRKQ